jgi:hypothetical protein
MNDRYPRTADVNSYAELADVLAPVARLSPPDEASFTFVGYASTSSGTFTLRARAKDAQRTLLEVTPDSIRPVRDPG